MDGHMLDGLRETLKFLMIVCAIAVPLGLWKLFEIILWLCRHVSIN